MISPEASAEPGKWSTARAEYQRGIMDAVATHETTVAMTSSQVGKTELLLNTAAYFIDQDPSPILALQPTIEMAATFSKDRLAPMLRDTPKLKGKVKDPRARDSGNTLRHKEFPGGHISLAGANSPASLASRPIRVLLADEIDRYAASAGTEGDPLLLARKRTTNFWNRRILEVSTPTRKGFSRIEMEWERSDKRYFMVPCRHCGHEQRLLWKNVRWPKGDPAAAHIHCEGCGTEWREADRLWSIRNGTWVATAKSHGNVAGFHLSELYSPWSTPGDVAVNFIAVKDDPDKLMVWTNTSLGELWEDDAEKVDANALYANLEDWGSKGDGSARGEKEPIVAPDDVLVITCGVDVQVDRLEIERVGWGMDEESWSLDVTVIYGDPAAPELWKQLDQYFAVPTMKHNGQRLPVHAACIDSGGHYTQQVYKYCAARIRRRIFSVKGAGGQGRPVWPQRGTKVKHGTVFVLGVDAAKDVIYARAKMKEHGPGYNHFPTCRDRIYFDQFTAEQVITRKSKGFPVRVYELPAGKRNEALDLRVYAYAALQSLHVKWGVAKAASQKATVPRPQPPAPRPASEGAPARQPTQRGRIERRSGWLNRH